MKFIQMVLATLLLVFVGSAYADSVEILNLEDGDLVSADSFTIIGKASGYAQGGELLVVLEICSWGDGTCEDAFLDCEGIYLTGRVSIQNKVMKRICPIKRGNIMIVGKSGDYEKDDNLQLALKIWNPLKEEWQEDYVSVFTE